MNNGELVTVSLDPPRTVRDVKASYWLDAPECESIQLPKAYIELAEGQTVESVTIPRWLAEDRGLTPVEEHDDNDRQQPDPITRHDWFTMAAITGLCSGFGNPKQLGRGDAIAIVEAARKIADKATGE